MASLRHIVAIAVLVLLAGSLTAFGWGRPATSPSGQSLPGALSGWTQTFADDFNGSALNTTKWFSYDGEPGGDEGTLFRSSHVAVSGGQLIISDYLDQGIWSTGGIQQKTQRTYGKYMVRFRFAAGPGFSHALILWPADNHWPPEIDFSEDQAHDQMETIASLHYGADNQVDSTSLALDLSQWHTLGIEWTRGRIILTCDGREWDRLDSVNIPSIPMRLCIQSQAWVPGQPNGWFDVIGPVTQAKLYVDWAVAYRKR